MALYIVDAVTDFAALERGGAWSIDSAKIGGKTYLCVGAYDDNGLQVLRLNANGTMATVDAVADDTDTALTNVNQGITFSVGAVRRRGVSIFAIRRAAGATQGSLVHVDTVFNADPNVGSAPLS